MVFLIVNKRESTDRSIWVMRGGEGAREEEDREGQRRPRRPKRERREHMAKMAELHRNGKLGEGKPIAQRRLGWGVRLELMKEARTPAWDSVTSICLESLEATFTWHARDHS